MKSFSTGETVVSVQEVATGLDMPWGKAFMPDGRMLITKLPGNLVIVSPDGSVSDPVEGTPDVFHQQQCGLMDVALHPDFDENQLVYLTFAEPGEGNTAGTALGRGRLVDNRLEAWEVIFGQEPKVDGALHFGNRIAFDGDLFPEWRGDIFFGALSAGGVERVDLENGEVAGTEFLPLNTRIREVEQGPDGAIYFLTNVTGDQAGAIWRMEPREVRPLRPTAVGPVRADCSSERAARQLGGAVRRVRSAPPQAFDQATEELAASADALAEDV